MFVLKDIQTNEEICNDYVQAISDKKTFLEIIQNAHQLCPELKIFCNQNQSLFKGLGKRDKGSVGKMAEFYLFGQLPNTDPTPDLEWGADIKATHFKTVWQKGFGAKERVTITNCGNTDDYETFNEVMATASLQMNKYYSKIQKGVLFVFEHKSGKYNDYETNLGKDLLCVFTYNLERLPFDITEQLNADFANIQHRIKTNTVSQRGQKYLHIHPHGSKGSKTRAFGFTNKFVTKLVSIETNKPLTTKGNSFYIDKKYF